VFLMDEWTGTKNVTCCTCPFLSLSIVHKKSFTKKKILRDNSRKNGKNRKKAVWICF
jgi:hypothetical protein